MIVDDDDDAFLSYCLPHYHFCTFRVRFCGFKDHLICYMRVLTDSTDALSSLRCVSLLRFCFVFFTRPTELVY